jgi:hypothetical protein
MSWPTIEALLWDLRMAISRLEGRVDGLEARQNRSEDAAHDQKIKVSDLLPLAGGCLILGLTLWGKPELAAAVGAMFGR